MNAEQQTGHATATAVAFPSAESLEERIEADQIPKDAGRILSSVVSGAGTLLFAAMAVAVAVLALQMPSPPNALIVAAGVLVLGGTAVGMGWLTWRWARSLPPVPKRELDDSERRAFNRLPRS